MKIELKEPFKSLWKVGYLREARDGRKRIDLKNSNTMRTTISYARYLVCVEQGKILSNEYHVDHVNKDCSDDRLENLQVLTITEHLEKTRLEASTGRSVKQYICPNCNESFQRFANLSTTSKRVFCSRPCNGLYYSNKKNHD